MGGDSDTADLRKDIAALREQMVRVEEGQKHGHAQLDRLHQSLGRHEAEDDARFARHEAFIAGENGLFQRVGKLEQGYAAGKWVTGTILGTCIATAVGLGWALLSGFLKAGGGP